MDYNSYRPQPIKGGENSRKNLTMMGNAVRRTAVLLIALIALPMGMMAQEENGKFAWTTQMFLNELKEQAVQPPTGRRQAPRMQTDGTLQPEGQRMIASPDTIGGKVYISCIIHLKDTGNLSDIQALGVVVNETFDGLDFVTAHVPVDQIEALAAIDNVTNIKVSQLMRPMTDVAKQLTHVDDLLNLSQDASAVGVYTKYDGTGVVLGLIDTGFDFQHIAFKDKNGNSRIQRAYIYNSSVNSSGKEYTDATSIANLTTDDETMDHGTHTASTAGGSSVIVNKISNTDFTITVTDDHANATYGGMAPGADLYLAGVKNLKEAGLLEALQKIVDYADAVKKPLVVSNSWGAPWGPRDGTGEIAKVVNQYFGDDHPNHIILFSTGNEAGHRASGVTGGYFLKGSGVTSTKPLATVLRAAKTATKYNGSYVYATSTVPLTCTLYVLDVANGAVLAQKAVTADGDVTFTDQYTGKLTVKTGTTLTIKATDLVTEGDYTLAIEVYPKNADASADINMWASQDGDFRGKKAGWTDTGHEWTPGTDDMCVTHEATIANAISVGAYVSRKTWKDYNGDEQVLNNSNRFTEGDIAYFSGYATAACSPTGEAYPWITAPGSMVIAGVSPYHTTGEDSYFDGMKARLVVNSTTNPYGAMQGTSMATPIAAGIVALWLQAANEVGKGLTVNDVKTIMEQTAIHDSYTDGTNGTNVTHFGKGKIDALAGIRYIRQVYGGKLALPNNADNTQTIAAAAATNKTYDVTLTGRTLFRNGTWNTLCLPFDVGDIDAASGQELEDTPLEGATLMTLANSEGSSTGYNAGKLNLEFVPAKTIDAGVAYIVKWGTKDSHPDTNIENPVFTGVTVTTDTPAEHATTSYDGYVSFMGTYAPEPIYADPATNLYLGADNKIYYPSSNTFSLNPFRAYFQLKNGLICGEPNNPNSVRSFSLGFGEGEGTQTGIGHTEGLARQSEGESQRADAWYTLDGRRLYVPPTRPGLYIHRGKKAVKGNR